MKEKNRVGKGYAYQIDSLRFIAMLSIFCSHCRILTFHPCTGSFFEKYMHYGGIGVEFFILLSGFLAAYTYNNSIRYRRYLTKRAIRFFPVYWSSLVFYIIAIYVTTGFSLAKYIQILFSVFLLQSATPSTPFINMASWTVSTLWCLCLLTPFLYKWLVQRSSKLLLSLLFASLIIGFVLNFLFFDHFEYFFYKSPYYRIVTYSQGMIASLLFVRNANIFDRLSFKKMTLVELIVVVLFLVELCIISDICKEGYYYTAIFLMMITVFFVGGGANCHLC